VPWAQRRRTGDRRARGLARRRRRAYRIRKAVAEPLSRFAPFSAFFLIGGFCLHINFLGRYAFTHADPAAGLRRFHDPT
jgi:hypothetical protein